MRTIRTLALALVAAASALAAQALAAAELSEEQKAALALQGDPARGAALYQPCVGCHRQDGSGRSSGAYPRLAGQYSTVIVKQLLDILKLRLTKRGIDIACLKIDDPVINLATAKQVITLRQGVEAELGKKIQKLIKESKLKVQAAIQDKKVRVTGKNRDDLQAAIAVVRKEMSELPLSFTNFRE